MSYPVAMEYNPGLLAFQDFADPQCTNTIPPHKFPTLPHHATHFTKSNF